MISNKKLDAAIHYVCARCEDSSRLGATKLNKIMLFADLAQYINTGKSLTGSKYKKLQHGPVPAGVMLSIKSLQDSGKLLVKSANCYGYNKTEYISLEEPSLDNLEKQEIDLLSVLMDDICNNHTATSISDITHDRVWDAASMHEEIPMGAYVIARSGKINASDKLWADNIIANV